jgi:hypothetical protein
MGEDRVFDLREYAPRIVQIGLDDLIGSVVTVGDGRARLAIARAGLRILGAKETAINLLFEKHRLNRIA